MAVYKVEVGGFVTVFRHQMLTIHAEDEAEAESKAIDKFIQIQSQTGDCDDATVDSVEKVT